MALRKSYGSYSKQLEFDVLDEEGKKIGTEIKTVHFDARHVDMHPLEEAAILAHWALHPIESQIPHPLFAHEEMDLLLAEGVEAVRAKRKARQDIMESLQPQIDEAKRKADEAHDAWCKHAELCCAHGHDPDTYPGDAREKLTMPDNKDKPNG